MPWEDVPGRAAAVRNPGCLMGDDDLPDTCLRHLVQALDAPVDATLYETDTGTVIASTGIPTGALMPMFSPDGQLLVFNDYAIGNAHGLALMDFDATTKTASKSFPIVGTYTVRLRVVDNNGAATILARQITIGNRAPVAQFTFAPATPVAGDTVTFTSTSTDEGSIKSQAWDFDGDGAFDDGTAATATHVFAACNAAASSCARVRLSWCDRSKK